MTDFKKQYQTATGFSDFVAFIGWMAIVAASIGGFILFNEAGSFGLIALPICLASALVGLLLVVSGQSLKAQLDTANASKMMLELAIKAGEK